MNPELAVFDLSRTDDGKERVAIDESELKTVFERWVEHAREMTLDELGAFVTHLADDYQHDYSSICYAIIAASIAAAVAVDSSPQGGITGFQAGYIANTFARKWLQYGDDEPITIKNYRDMLFPQYAEQYTTIDQETWDYLQREAAKRLEEPFGVPRVREHWQSIVDGNVPFGYSVR